MWRTMCTIGSEEGVQGRAVEIREHGLQLIESLFTRERH